MRQSIQKYFHLGLRTKKRQTGSIPQEQYTSNEDVFRYISGLRGATVVVLTASRAVNAEEK